MTVPMSELQEAVEALEFYADGFRTILHPTKPGFLKTEIKDELFEDAGEKAKSALKSLRACMAPRPLEQWSMEELADEISRLQAALYQKAFGKPPPGKEA